MKFDVALVSPRSLWRPATPTDAPPAYTIRRYLYRRLSQGEAGRRAALLNHRRFTPDDWCVAVPHVPQRAMQPAELLKAAETMLTFRVYGVAAILCRQALESSIKDLHAACGCRPVRREAFSLYVDGLRQARIIDAHTRRRIVDLAEVGHLAAHNCAVSVPEVKAMLNGVRQFLNTCPVFAQAKGGAA